MFVHNLENELKGQQVVKKNANEGTAKDPTFLFLSQVLNHSYERFVQGLNPNFVEKGV